MITYYSVDIVDSERVDGRKVPTKYAIEERTINQNIYDGSKEDIYRMIDNSDNFHYTFEEAEQELDRLRNN